VRGAYDAAAPGSQPDRRQFAIAGQPLFHLDVDLFDAGRHRFPYPGDPDASFDVVLCAELIEHLTLDPMHLSCECHHVLADIGLVPLTTPTRRVCIRWRMRYMDAAASRYSALTRIHRAFPTIHRADRRF